VPGSPRGEHGTVTDGELNPALGAADELAIVARELATLIDRITDAATAAWGLAAATDWQARAATAFHAKAETWAGDVSGLVCLAETARLDAAVAAQRLLLIATSPYERLLLGGAR
jgi:hypothetical protein